MALPPGTFVDVARRYEVLKLLGQGGMATAYEVLDHRSRQNIALKLASTDPSVRESAKRRLIAEFDVASRIQGEGIVKILEKGEGANGVPFYTMELLQGEPLGSWLSTNDAVEHLGLTGTVALLTDIAKSLKAVHEAGFVFADLTPGNIFLSEVTGRLSVTLIDFGLACKSVPFEESKDLSVSQHGSLVGTKTHISPEQVRGEPLTNRTDIYAFGIVAFQICTGQLPYQMENPLALIANQAVSKVPSVRSRNPNIPKSLELIIQVAMEKSPSDRFSSMDEIVDYLGKVQSRGLFARLTGLFSGRSEEQASK